MHIKGVLDKRNAQVEYIEAENIWTSSKTFKIVKGKNDDDIKILGGTIQFDGDVEEGDKKRTASDYISLF
jgi:hypothetical protein